jgi:hypothetical protein
MKHVDISVDIQSPPDRVWAVMRDIERWPEWTPTVTSVRQLEPGPLVVGTRALIRQPKLPPAEWKITELDDANRSFTWITRGPGVQVLARHWVEAADGGSRATLSIEFSGLLGALVARLTHGLNQRYLALEAKGLKQRSESGSGSESRRPAADTAKL